MNNQTSIFSFFADNWLGPKLQYGQSMIMDTRLGPNYSKSDEEYTGNNRESLFSSILYDSKIFTVYSPVHIKIEFFCVKLHSTVISYFSTVSAFYSKVRSTRVFYLQFPNLLSLQARGTAQSYLF